MAVKKSEISSIVKRAERIAKSETDRLKRKQIRESEDPEMNRRALMKRRTNWIKKFNFFILPASAALSMTFSANL